MNTGDFIWFKPMRTKGCLRPAVVLKPATIHPGLAYRLGVPPSTQCGWRIALLDTTNDPRGVQICEVAEGQVTRRMTPLEALAWSVSSG